MSERCCILGMPHTHEKREGSLLVMPDGQCRFLSRWERFIYRNFWIEPREIRQWRKAASHPTP